MNPLTPMPTTDTDPEVSKKTIELRKDILGLFLLFLLALNLFYPMFFENQAIFYRDFHFITYPFRYFLSQAYHEGVIPYWTPSVYGGMPFMSAFHPGVFYPPSVVFFLPDTLFAINLFYFIHFLVLGSFLYLLGKMWGLSFAARLCSSTTGMLSGFIVAATLTSNFFLSAVWLPLVFWMYLKYREEKRIGYFIGAVLAIATQTLAACPEINIMTMVLLYAHCLWFMPKGEGVAGYGRMTLSLGLAVVLALGLSALQLWPTAKLIDQSRRDGGIPYEEHTAWSLEPSKLTTLVITPGYRGVLDSKKAPIAFSGLIHTIYMGLIGLALIVIGFCFRREKAVGFWLLVFLLGILFALGEYNPLYRYFYDWAPLAKWFRFPQKYFYVSSFAAAFLTGFVLDLLIQGKRFIKIRQILILLIILFGGVALIGLGKPYLEIEISMSLLFIFGVSYVLFYFQKIKKPVFSVLVFLLILFDLCLKSFQLLPLLDRKFFEEKPLYMDILEDSAGEYRIYSGKIEKELKPDFYPNGNTYLDSLLVAKQYLRPYTGMVLGVEHVMGLPGLAMGLKDHLLYFAYLQASEPDKRLRILKRSNVKYWINQDRPTYYTLDGNPVILPDYVEVFRDALPRAFLVPQARAPGEGNVLNTYYDEAFDPLKEVLLSQPLEFEASEGFEGRVDAVTYSPNHVTVKTSQEGNGFLVLLDSYFPGWTVTVDGEERPILRANHYYRAVQLGPGEHTLEFDYFPEGFKAGLVVSAVFLLILIALPLCKPLQRQPLLPSLPVSPDPAKPVDSGPA